MKTCWIWSSLLGFALGGCGTSDSPSDQQGSGSTTGSATAGSGGTDGSGSTTGGGAGNSNDHGAGGSMASGGAGFGGGGAGSGGSDRSGSGGRGGSDGSDGSDGVDDGSAMGGGSGMDGGSGTSGACSAVPVTPNATQQAKNVLCYLYSQYGNHILSGQEEGGSNSEIDYIFQKTGKYPAIRAFDLLNSGDPTRCMAWWNAGGICMFGYHMGAPGQPDNYQGSQATVSINSVLTAGTSENTVFKQRLDNVATALLQVQNANGMVIWRPFHEAGGTWFWWSKEGGAQYVRLWKYMFDYLTNTKGVKAVLWLLPYDGSPQASFYPGKDFVDIAAADNYDKAFDYSPMTSIFNTTRNIAGTTIPIALHENGPIPDPDQLQSSQTNWVFFNTWTSPYPTDDNSVTQLMKTYSSSYVITRDEVPSLK